MPRGDEWVAAAQGLTGSAATGHKAFQAGTQVAGLSGIWELLAAQVGCPEILTALKRGPGDQGSGRGERTAVTSYELAPGLSPRPPRRGHGGEGGLHPG